MQLLQKDITLDGRGDSIELIPLGDIHIGTKNCDEEKLMSTVEYIRQRPNCYWLGMGDYCDLISYQDPRFSPDNLSPHFLNHLDNLAFTQVHYILNILSPIKDKCLGLLEGNHEGAIKKHHQINVTDCLSFSLGVRNLSYTAFIRLGFIRIKGHVDRSVTVFATHGAGGGIYFGGKANRLLAKSKDFDADIFLNGHVHEIFTDSRYRLCLSKSNPPKLIERKQIFAITGTFLRTYTEGTEGYGERPGYSPGKTGVVKIRISPFVSKWINGQMTEMPPHIHISE